MRYEQISRKIRFIDRNIRYYKRVYPGNTEKLFELLNERKYYKRKLKVFA